MPRPTLLRPSFPVPKERTQDFSMSMNSVRLLHLKYRKMIDVPCARCGIDLTTVPTHWRIRARYMIDKEDVMTVQHACSEECARAVYDIVIVELALASDKPVTTQERGVTKHAR